MSWSVFSSVSSSGLSLGGCQAETRFTDASDLSERDPKCSLTRGLVDTRSPIFSSHFDARCCLRHEISRCLVHACTNVTFLTTTILIATPPKIYCRTRYTKIRPPAGYRQPESYNTGDVKVDFRICCGQYGTGRLV